MHKTSLLFALLLAFIGIPNIGGVVMADDTKAETLARLQKNITGQVTFLYYKDMDTATSFYGETLGLKKTFDQGWVKFFQIADNAFVGLVDSEKGFHKASGNKPVMLSIITDDVVKWHAYIKMTDVKITSPLGEEAGKGLVRGFIVTDPGGYSVEFFQWNK